jgi:hypothetical protein
MFSPPCPFVGTSAYFTHTADKSTGTDRTSWLRSVTPPERQMRRDLLIMTAQRPVSCGCEFTCVIITCHKLHSTLRSQFSASADRQDNGMLLYFITSRSTRSSPGMYFASLSYLRGGLISLWLYKENNKLWDWKNIFTLHIPPWAAHTYDFLVLTSLAHPRKILLFVLQIGK